MHSESKAANIEEKLLEQYGGRGSHSLPQTLMFDHVSPATRLLEKRRQMFEVQEALNAQKEEFARREDAFRRREDGLRRKDLELQESLIKFNKFLQENESKRNRALKRAAEEFKQRQTKESQIAQLEDQLKSKLREEAVLKEEVERNLKYQDYLENVVQTMSKFFPEISDILNRYKTLRDANMYLIDKHHTDESATDSLQREYLSYKKTKENLILNESNEIADKQLALEHHKTRTNRVQADIDKVAMEASEKGLELGQIISSVSNILARCEESFRIRHNKPHIDRSADKLNSLPLADQFNKTVSRLDEVAMFMVDYRDIINEYNAAHDTANRTRGALGVTSQHTQSELLPPIAPKDAHKSGSMQELGVASTVGGSKSKVDSKSVID